MQNIAIAQENILILERKKQLSHLLQKKLLSIKLLFQVTGLKKLFGKLPHTISAREILG